MVGEHCIKTWSATQAAIALSSAEAELYAIVEAVTRAKALVVLAEELGFKEVGGVVKLGTDSSAARSFCNRWGIGKMAGEKQLCAFRHPRRVGQYGAPKSPLVDTVVRE